jgi:hypothetical protein
MVQVQDVARAPVARHIAGEGSLAALISTGVLLWRGLRDSGSAVAPLNAVAHWLWPRSALRADTPTWRYTGVGSAVHTASSMLWAGLYGLLRSRRRRPTPANALTDAAVVTAIAATVDLKLVPPRLTPGFEHRLTRPSLLLVYAGFGLGLALGGLLALRR